MSIDEIQKQVQQNAKFLTYLREVDSILIHRYNTSSIISETIISHLSLYIEAGKEPQEFADWYAKKFKLSGVTKP